MCARAWERAKNQAALGNYEKAKEYIREAYRRAKLDAPSSEAPFDWNMLASQIAARNGCGPLALEAVQIALEQVSQDRRLKPADREYLTHYCE